MRKKTSVQICASCLSFQSPNLYHLASEELELLETVSNKKGRILSVRKVLRRRVERFLNVLSMFNLRPASSAYYKK